MKTAWTLFWGISLLILGLLLFWKNSKTYHTYSVVWRIVKSLIDMVLLLASAIYLPALLIGWCVYWAMRPMKESGLKTTITVLVGVIFGVAGYMAIEGLVLCGIFSVDLVTGEQGALKHWKNSKKLVAQAA